MTESVPPPAPVEDDAQWQFAGSSAGETLFAVTQGNGVLHTDASSYGWQQVALGNPGGPTSHYIGWGLIEFTGGSAGQAGHEVTVDFGNFINELDNNTFGSEFRGGVGLPIGHATVTIGGVHQPEPYHVVMDSSSFGGTVCRLVEADGTRLGLSETLQDGDVIEFQLSCFLTTD